MIKKIILLILAIGVGIFFGVIVVVNQTNNLITKKIMEQQRIITDGQRIIIQKLGVNTFDLKKAGQPSLDADPQAIVKKLKELEARIVDMETQLKANLSLAKVTQPSIARQPSPTKLPEDFSKKYNIETAHSLVKGPKDASVTVVEFSDFQCPFSSQFHPILMEAIKAYPDEVNYIIKNFPLSFHPQARLAAKAAFAAAEQGKYFEMVDALLANSRNLNEETYKRSAGELGLNVNKFLVDLKEKDVLWEEYLAKDLVLTREVEVRGTPTFFINGRKTLARDVESLKKEIGDALNEN